MHQLGGDLYVKKATVEFNASARMDDQLDVGLKCGRIGNSSMAFTGAIFRGDELLITCELIYVFADPASQTSKPVPPLLREILSGYEAGEGMVQVKTGSWADLGNDAKKIRTRGFRRGTAHSRRHGMGRGRRHGGSRGRVQPAGPARGHRAAAATRARRGEDRPDGGSQGAARLRRGPSGARGIAGGSRQRGATRKPFCMPSAAPRTSIAAWDSSRAATRSRKRESPISRCHGRSPAAMARRKRNQLASRPPAPRPGRSRLRLPHPAACRPKPMAAARLPCSP